MIVIIDHKTFNFNFDWPKYVDMKFKREIEFIIKSNKSFAENIIKSKVKQLLLWYKHGNSKANEPQKFALNLSRRLDLRKFNKHVTLKKLSIYYTWKNIRKQYQNKKLKITALVWNDEYEMPSVCYSVSDIFRIILEIAPTKSSATFQINSVKPFVPVVILSIKDNIKFLENIEQGFKRTISWNKYRSEITTQPKIII